MRRLSFLAAAFALLATAALADAPPSHYDVTVLSQADVDFYLSVKRAGADCVVHATGADKDAIDTMRRNHGVLPVPAMPNIKGNPTPAQLADLQKHMSEISAQATRNGEIEGRASALSQCDEKIAQQRGQKDRYLAIKNVVESAVPMNGDGCSGDCGGDGHEMKATPAQLALWKKEDEVRKADAALLAPHAGEIRKLQKTMMSAMGQ